MRAAVGLVLAVLLMSAVSIEGQIFGYPGYGYPGYGYPPYYGGGLLGGRPFGPAWGQGRGLAFLGSAALLARGNPLGQAIGGLGRGFGFGYPRYGYGFGPRWGAGRGLAFLGSAALLRSGNPLGRAVGAVGLGSLLFG